MPSRNPSQIFELERRRFLAHLLGCGCVAALPVLTGCTISEIFGDTSERELEFDLLEARFAPLKKPGGMVAVDLGARKALLIRRSKEEIIALDRICPHEACDMAPEQDGRWSDDALLCLCHGSRFAPDGQVITGPADTDLQAHKVEFQEGETQGSLLLGSSPKLEKDKGVRDDSGVMEEPSIFVATLDSETRQLQLELSAHSSLAAVGGLRAVDLGRLSLIIIRSSAEEFITLDRLCTHRLCDMAPHLLGSFDPQEGLLCQCHDSLFSLGGEVLQGPAREPLQTYPTQFNSALGLISIEIPEGAI